MVDPFLFDALHGVSYPKQQLTGLEPTIKPEAKNSYDAALDEAIKEHVDSLMAVEDAEGNKWTSPTVRRAKLEHEIRAATDLSEFGKHMTSAFKILRSESLYYLEKKENDALQESLEELNQHLTDLELKKLDDETLKAALAISAESKNFILKIGIAKFSEGLIDDCLAIFTFLSAVDEEDPDYWYRLGLVAQKSENYELALKAFAATSWLAPDFIGARIFAAQCYIKNGMREDALAELQEAKRILKTTVVLEEWQKYVFDVESLLSESK